MNDEPEFHQEIAGIQHEDNEPDTGANQNDNDAEMDDSQGVANSHIVDAKDEDESQQESDSEQDEVESRQINPDRNDDESESKIEENEEGSFHTANDKSVTPSSQVQQQQ